MPIDTMLDFLDAMRQGAVLSEERLRRLGDDVTTWNGPRELAKELVQRGWLTHYQAKQLLAGHGGDLTVGPYRVLDRLGQGGMGQVFQALHVPMNRVVALKVVRPDLMSDPTTLRRFRREVHNAAQLSHPNIVTVFDANQIKDVFFLAMEYIDGIDLAALVRDAGPQPVAPACDYVRQAALGLHHAHERGIIHRDVKPSNLLVTRAEPAGVVKILDMGLARAAAVELQAAHSVLTVDGTIVGTPDFMSPEQAKNSAAVDHRSDLYSLGCTLYFLLTGRLPFPDGNVMDKLMKHQLEQPYPVELVRNDVPAELLPVLQRTMAKRPDDRYQGGEELSAALAPFCYETAAVSVNFLLDPEV
ncbi:MAG: serine/threonine-protein kinase, partial [Gemmataceae bacterium]